MAVTQIIGPRIAPLWADPAEWSSTRAYEPYTFVTYQGDSYCSRQDTPIGINITNDDYWVKVSDFNAQAVALQRSMTQTIETAETNMADTIQTAKNDMTQTIETAETNMADTIQTAKNDMTKQVNDVTKVSQQFSEQISNVQTLNEDATKYLLIFGDSWSGANTDGSWGGDSEGAGEAQRWWHTVASQMQLSVLNYALGGSRFGGTTDAPRYDFAAQLAKAKNEISDTVKRNIQYVIIFGGVNDLLSSKYTATFMQFANRVYNFAASVKSWLPNARINVVAPNAPRYDDPAYDRVSGSASNYWAAPIVCRERLNANGIMYYDPRFWLFGYDAYVSDTVHPNALGHQIIAAKMLGILNNNLQEKTADTWWRQDPSNVITSNFSNVVGVPIEQSGCEWTSSYTFNRGTIINESSLVGFSAEANTWAFATIQIPNHYIGIDSFQYDNINGSIIMFATNINNGIQLQCKSYNTVLRPSLQIRAVLKAHLE